MTSSFQIYPSILSADFARLGEEAAAVLKAGADGLHFDVMDNHYVPNLTVGPLVCEALRHFGIKALIDVHLMVQPVDTLINDFIKAGASHITFHPEASLHIDRSLDLIKSKGVKAGLALNPATPWQLIEFVLDKLDFILVMSVNPGFGGQRFIPATLEKIKQIREFLDKEDAQSIRIAVDGGVNLDNIQSIARAGADTFIAGSAIFKAHDYREAIAAMNREISKL